MPESTHLQRLSSAASVAVWDISLSPWAVRLDMENVDNRLAIEIGECVAAGERLYKIAARKGVTKGQLRMWINAAPERLLAYKAGLDAQLDEEMLDALEKNREIVGIADNDEDDDFRAKRRIGGRTDFVKNTLALVSKLDRARYGDGAGVVVNLPPASGGEVDVVTLARKLAFLLAKGTALAAREVVTVDVELSEAGDAAGTPDAVVTEPPTFI